MKHSHTFSTSSTLSGSFDDEMGLRQILFHVCVQSCWQQQKREIDFIWEPTLGMEAVRGFFFVQTLHFSLFKAKNKRGVLSLGCALPFSGSFSSFFFEPLFCVCVRAKDRRWRPSSGYSSQLNSGGFYSFLQKRKCARNSHKVLSSAKNAKE